MVSRYSLFSPTDYRYSVEALQVYLVRSIRSLQSQSRGGVGRILARKGILDIASEITTAAER
jgi:hypothetical protein